ncbi:hypothetical protein AAFN85_17120 [Mucilaginibacter sp. CAU 1740]|uniref:hypothetical protein n=1 Tax=Mucilaginibacter sp. CAU 1740 TaxID=3140365 RepID=UPI00325BDC50
MNNLLIKIKEFDAHGGPSTKKTGMDGHEMTPTRSGRYVVGAVEKHISYGKYAYWSGVPWGAGLKFIGDVTYVDVNNNGHWQKLSTYRPIWLNYYKTEMAIKNAIKVTWLQLKVAHYSGSEVLLYDTDLPEKWLFNDFGHVSVKYFVDRNHDGIMNRGETFMGDFIHTTPHDEAITSYNRRATAAQPRFQVNLAESHGCVHVKPADVDVMIGSGYIKKGQSIVVHAYSDKSMMPTIKADRYTRPGFEVHFFPGLFKIAVYKVT